MSLLHYRALAIFAVTLTLIGCNLVEQQSEPAGAGRFSGAPFPEIDPDALRQSHHRGDIRAAHKVNSATDVGAAYMAAYPSAYPAQPSTAAQGSTSPKHNFNLNVYGLSYHPDREGARRSNVGNEVNKGLGLGYEFHNNDQGVAFVEAGFYEDSGRNWAKFAGPGYQFKLGERWRLGGAMLVIQSPTYNNGRTFVAPIPLLTYDFGMVKLNALYAPRFRQKNDFSVFGFYISIPFSF